MDKRYPPLIMLGASFVCLCAYILLSDSSFRQESAYLRLQVNSYKLATGWHRAVGNVRGLIYVIGPLQTAISISRNQNIQVLADIAILEAELGGIDQDVADNVRQLIQSIRVGMNQVNDILDIADNFLSQEDLPPGISDGRQPMAGFLGRDVSRILSPKTEYSYFQLIRKLKEMNAFFDELYINRLNNLLDSITTRADAIRGYLLVARLLLLGITAVLAGLLVWQLYGLNRYLRRLADRTGNELESTRLNLHETAMSLQNARFQLTLFELVTGVAHELNTPLGISITASTFMDANSRELSAMLEQATPNRNTISSMLAKNQQGMDLLLSNLQRMKHQIDTFKMLAASNHHEAQAPIAASRYLDQRIRVLGAVHVGKISIFTSLDADADFPVHAENLDPIFTELLDNSVIHGSASLITISFAKRGRTLKIRYSDNGAGVRSEYLPRLAEPFFTTARASKHMGLGLSIVMSLVANKLQGKLYFEPGSPGLITNIDIPFKVD